MEDNRIPVRALGAVDAKVDGDLVILSPKDFAYLGMVGNGEAVWDLIDGQRSVAEMVQILEERYESRRGAIARETVAFLGSLEEAGLVTGISTAAVEQ